MTQPPTVTPPKTATEALRAIWDQQMRGLPQDGRPDDLSLRIHRCLSWYERAETLRVQDGTASEDDQLVFTWTALNSLYGRWLFDRRESAPDIQSLELFLDTLFDLDRKGALAEFIEDRLELIYEVFDNQFLAKQFWNDPTIQAAERRTSLGRQARTWFIEGRKKLILEKLLRNVYYLRCQLIHGAATRKSSLNRDTVRSCLGALSPLLPVILKVIMENGIETDWGPTCYPVVK